MISKLLLFCLFLTACAEIPIQQTVQNNQLEDEDLRIIFLNVSQGDATILIGNDVFINYNQTSGEEIGRFVQQEVMMIDCGPKSAVNHVIDVLKRNGVKRIVTIVATNPDADHIGGCADIMQQFPVSNVKSNVWQKNTKTFSEFISAVGTNRAYIKNDQGWTDMLFNGFFGIYNVSWMIANDTNIVLDGNDASIITWIQRGSFSALFPGDCEKSCEMELLKGTTPIIPDPDVIMQVRQQTDEGIKKMFEASQETSLYIPRVTLLKAGHHGSHTSSNPEFLDRVEPQIMVISSAGGCPYLGCSSQIEGNRYGHPRSVTISEALDRDIEILRTDIHGDIEIVVDKHGNYAIRTER